jgi:hypothetical protein
MNYYHLAKMKDRPRFPHFQLHSVSYADPCKFIHHTSFTLDSLQTQKHAESSLLKDLAYLIFFVIFLAGVMWGFNQFEKLYLS